MRLFNFRFHTLALLLLYLMGLRTGWADDPRPLVLGVFPYVTARQIVEIYHPVAKALEIKLQRRVRLFTARDFTAFAERTRKGEYDILLTAPHLVWLARQEVGYLPLLKYDLSIYGLLVVKSDSPFKDLEDLRGRTIATPDSISLVALAGKAEMAARGLRDKIDYASKDATTHINAAMQVINGRVDGAMLAQQTYNLMRPELRQQLRVLAGTPPLPSLMYLTHPRLPITEVQSIRTALLDFSASPDEQARKHYSANGAIEPIDDAMFPAIRPYALSAQEMLRQTK
ncbi:MAG: phosphate/phosphite/phosphonate ABC transporter substrate-binding protein [Sulfuriferula multivorans]|uniref:Phosphate/phosphite/phosphonate ABC transporter substrate-binding protein n=1 Tax=Sulfuriferula multivorans TaxID=1559896 RepID=A0A7C9JVF6_9PROT|nr:phosphate/phosphite/phosphonate ABC transporter substrate-binding protein [Sulfuriferula multivorans]